MKFYLTKVNFISKFYLFCFYFLFYQAKSESGKRGQGWKWGSKSKLNDQNDVKLGGDVGSDLFNFNSKLEINDWASLYSPARAQNRTLFLFLFLLLFLFLGVKTIITHNRNCNLPLSTEFSHSLHSLPFCTSSTSALHSISLHHIMLTLINSFIYLFNFYPYGLWFRGQKS